jgi:hypothetical protein
MTTDPLDTILDTYYAPIKLPEENREGLKAAIRELERKAYKKGYIDCGVEYIVNDEKARRAIEEELGVTFHKLKKEQDYDK